LFTVIAAASVGSEGHVYAFEPCAQTFRRLEENITLNRHHNVTAVNAALSDRVESREMLTSQDGYDAWNSLALPFAGAAFKREVINCTTWDTFVSERRLPRCVTLMKVDVEGWENHVLAGAKAHLERQDAPDLLVEFSDTTAALAGSSCSDLYRQIENLGYQLFSFDPTLIRIKPEPPRSSYEYANLVASKNPERVLSRVSRSVPDIGER
jgi:FkbM family methyltransferase